MDKGKKVTIVIATHKKYKMPADEMYLPLHVGAMEKGTQLDLGYVKDNTGENISRLNPSFCELTGLYWAWKNLVADYVGLVHYRRYFSMKKQSRDPWDSIMTYREIEPFLGEIKMFVPKKRRYYIETLYSHYEHTHYVIQLDKAREIIGEKYTDYLKSYDKVVRQRSGYMFNMMIMERRWLEAYCSWLFDILFELQKRIDMPDLSAFQARFYGRVSEILFNVWLDYQTASGVLRKSEVKEIPYIHMENINWMKKGGAFLGAKYLKRKYKGSF